MPYLDPYAPKLTAKTAAHLLRRVSFGPTPAEINAFTGLTAPQAIQILIGNANYSLAPLDLDETSPTAGQPLAAIPWNGNRNSSLGYNVVYWWLGTMLGHNQPITLVDKLTLFWQNHFVTSRETVDEYRFIWRYLKLLRDGALGNFRTLLIEVTKDPAMLKYLNGNENEAASPNENYGRELQELFTVGLRNTAGETNYTEDDVKAAARTLTGWTFVNHWKPGSTTIGVAFDPARHDPNPKTFSALYGHKTIAGRSGPQAGEEELADLVNLLLERPETPQFICRKLYRWFVNAEISPAIEATVIRPLAAFFASPANDWAIRPVLEKLLTSDEFFAEENHGAIIKSPAELMIGTLRFFGELPRDPVAYPTAYRKYMDFLYYRMRDIQQPILDQLTVFGYEPYYQTGYSRLWINASTLVLRNEFTDYLVQGWYVVESGYRLQLRLVETVAALQPNFADAPPAGQPTVGTPALTAAQVVDGLLANLFATELAQGQKEFLIDVILMQELPRSTWEFEWNAYRRDPNDPQRRSAVQGRLQNLTKYLLRMAEYQIG